MTLRKHFPDTAEQLQIQIHSNCDMGMTYVQVQARQNLSMERWDGHQLLPLSKDLLTFDNIWKKES